MSNPYQSQNQQAAAQYLGNETPASRALLGEKLAAGGYAYNAPAQGMAPYDPQVSVFGELARYADTPRLGRATGLMGVVNRFAGVEGETPLTFALRRGQANP